MGGSESKHADESQKLNTSQPGEDHTPLVNRRLTRLTDPRSPTDGVDRTPIVVDTAGCNGEISEGLTIDTSRATESTDAPDPRSPSANVARTPQAFAFPDPRSPSQNVARTPHIPHSKEGVDPRSPTDGIERTPYNKNPDAEARRSSFEYLVDDPDPSVQENLNTSNSNLEEDLETNPLEESDSCEDSPTLKTQLIKPSERLTQSDTPKYEVELSKMMEDQSLVTVYCEPEGTGHQEDDAPCTTKASQTKLKNQKKSLKAKVQQKFQAGAPRSPLSTRNLFSDSPGLQMHRGSSSVSYVDKTSTRRKHSIPTPTRLVGRYEPIVDKENA